MCIITLYSLSRRKQVKDIERVAELKKSYEASRGNPAYQSSNISEVYDYEEADPYPPKYPQPLSNTAYQTSSMGGTYARVSTLSNNLIVLYLQATILLVVGFE